MQRDSAAGSLPPDYNVAPTKPVYSVLTRRASAAGPAGPALAAGSGEAARELRVARWGLVPYWAKDISIGSRLINARAETVSEKPAFRRAFARRRCLLPADGYYEWQRPAVPAAPADGPDPGRAKSPARATSPASAKSPAKQPYFIRRADGRPLAFAGLYELWRDRQVPEEDPGAWLLTTTIITTSAPDELGLIHDRMPMIIDPASWADWLDPANTDTGELRSLLAPAAAGGLMSYPVSTAVNSVRNNGPDLIRPADAELAGASGGSPQLPLRAS